MVIINERNGLSQKEEQQNECLARCDNNSSFHTQLDNQPLGVVGYNTWTVRRALYFLLDFNSQRVVEELPVSINKRNFRELIVRPALQQLQMWSEAAEELLMLTAAQESHLGTYLRQGWKKLDDGKGAALGPFGVEKKTFGWLKALYGASHELGWRDAEEMQWDLLLAAKAARLRYRVVKEPLPSATDLQGLARYWKQYYNTVDGEGTVEEALANYRLFVQN